MTDRQPLGSGATTRSYWMNRGWQACQNTHPRLYRAAKEAAYSQGRRDGFEWGARVGVIVMGVVAVWACWGKR